MRTHRQPEERASQHGCGRALQLVRLRTRFGQRLARAVAIEVIPVGHQPRPCDDRAANQRSYQEEEAHMPQQQLAVGAAPFHELAPAGRPAVLFLHHDLVRSATDWAHDVKRRRAAGIGCKVLQAVRLETCRQKSQAEMDARGSSRRERAGRMAQRHRAGTHMDCFKKAPHSLREPIGSCRRTSRAKSSRRSFPHPPSRSNTGKSPRHLRTSLRRRATRPA